MHRLRSHQIKLFENKYAILKNHFQEQLNDACGMKKEFQTMFTQQELEMPIDKFIKSKLRK